MKGPNKLAIYALARAIVAGLAATALCQSDFYKGKTIKIVRGDGPAPLSGEELERAIKELPRD